MSLWDRRALGDLEGKRDLPGREGKDTKLRHFFKSIFSSPSTFLLSSRILSSAYTIILKPARLLTTSPENFDHKDGDDENDNSYDTVTTMKNMITIMINIIFDELSSRDCWQLLPGALMNFC